METVSASRLQDIKQIARDDSERVLIYNNNTRVYTVANTWTGLTPCQSEQHDGLNSIH